MGRGHFKSCHCFALLIGQKFCFFFFFFFFFFSILFFSILCVFFYFSVMQKEPRRQRFFRESRQTILQKSRQNGNLESKSRMYIQPKNQIVGIFNLIFITTFQKGEFQEKTSLWKNIEKVKMWWSHFLFLLQKISTNQFYPPTILLLCLHMNFCEN